MVFESPTSPPSPIVRESYPISRSNSSKLIWITWKKYIYFDIWHHLHWCVISFYYTWTYQNKTEKSSLHKYLSIKRCDLQWDYIKAPVFPSKLCLQGLLMKRQNVMTFVLLLLMTTIWWLQAQPSHFSLWPGGGQTLHNIRVKQPYYNAHISIITIIMVMRRFSVPSQWSVCLAKGTVAQSCDSGRSQWLLNHSCSWWLIVYHRVRRPRACKYTNEMPQPIQMSKSSGVPAGKKLWPAHYWEIKSHLFNDWLKSQKLHSW